MTRAQVTKWFAIGSFRVGSCILKKGISRGGTLWPWQNTSDSPVLGVTIYDSKGQDTNYANKEIARLEDGN